VRSAIALVLILSLGLTPLAAQMRLLAEEDPDPGSFTHVASNGFRLTVAAHDDHHDLRGVSLSGEAVTLHVTPPRAGQDVLETRMDGALLRSTVRADGTPVWEDLVVAGTAVARPALAEQQRLAPAESGGAEWDLAVYEELVAYALTRATPQFWEEFAAAGLEFEAAVAAGIVTTTRSCWLPCSGCLIALAGYGFSLAAVLAACGASAGLACILSVVGWEVGKAAVVLACVDCIECVQELKKADEDESGQASLPVKEL
jgi:hypothetical protein